MARLALVRPWLLLLLMMLGACDPVGRRDVETSSGETFAVGLENVIGRQHSTSEPDDAAGLHLEALRYVMAHPAFGYATDANKARAVDTLSRELQTPLNEILTQHGVATIFTPDFHNQVTLIVSKKAKLLLVRRWAHIGNWRSPYFSAFDLSQVPEALEPRASLSAQTFAQRVRFIEEPKQ